MTDVQILGLAEAYLRESGIEFVSPGSVHRSAELSRQAEAIFLVPAALDPNVVVDPPDMRMLVDEQTGVIRWIDQM